MAEDVPVLGGMLSLKFLFLLKCSGLARLSTQRSQQRRWEFFSLVTLQE